MNGFEEMKKRKEEEDKEAKARDEAMLVNEHDEWGLWSSVSIFLLRFVSHIYFNFLTNAYLTSDNNIRDDLKGDY